MALKSAHLGDYRLGAEIGSGATARVFEAVHVETGSRVAIKMLGAGAGTSAELRARLAREALILSGVKSRHIERIYAFGYHKEQPFLVLERLQGETLAALINSVGKLSARQVVHWVEQLLLGVRDCHASGVVHRDIKPANVFLVRENDEALVKLIDFGIARLFELAGASSLTKTQHVLGSMGYMAPEHLQGSKGAGPEADLYAIGVVVFRIVSGRLPFIHTSLEAVIRMKREVDPPLLSSMPNVVSIRALDEFCAKALALDPSKRHRTAAEMLDDWWNVVAYVDQDAPLTVDAADPSGLDIVFDEETTAPMARPRRSSLPDPT